MRLFLCTLLGVTVGCSSIPDRGDPGEVVLDEEGAAKSAVWRIEGMTALLFKDGAPQRPYQVEVRVAGGTHMSRLGLILVQDQRTYDTCGELTLHADGQDLPIRGMEYASTVSSNGWLEGWWLDVDVKSLAKMASGPTAGGTFCGVEWRLDKDQRAVLRKLVSKIVD
jgi:hypothetical protein